MQYALILKTVSMGHVFVGENELRQLHGQNDSQDDGDGDFAGYPPTLQREIELGVGEVIGKPENAGSRYQRENAAQEKSLGRNAERDGCETGQDAY